MFTSLRKGVIPMRKNMIMVLAMFLASLNLRPAINSVAPLLDSIRSDLSMSGAIASLMTSIPVLVMGFLSPIAVKAGGRWGIEKVMGGSLIIIALGTVIRLFTSSTAFLLVTALIAGLGIAFVGPLMSGFIKKHFPKQIPSMIAIYSVALTLGAAVSSALSSSLQQLFGSWRGSLASWAILAVVAAVVWWLFVLPAGAASSDASSARATAKLPWGNGKAWILTLSFGLMALLFYSYTAWMPQIIQDMGYSKSYASASLTIFVAVQIPVSLLIPVLLKRFPSRRVWLIASSSLEFVGLVLLALHAVPWLAAGLIGIGAGGLFSLNLLLPIDAAENAHEAASWSAMTQSVGYVIGALGPILLGKVHDASGSFASAIVGMIFIVVLMAVIQVAATASRRKAVQAALRTQP